MTRLRAEIHRHFDRWRPVLGLEGWDITLSFNETECQACCKAQPKYLKAELCFNVRRIRKELRRIAQREELVLHEMVHCVIWKASETAVSQVTLSLLRARESQW